MPELITYPPSINTDFDRLAAVYSLLERMRLEHNRVGVIARANWKSYRGKWAEYARIFEQKQLMLLQEQNRLRDAIRKGYYSDAQWRDLSLEERYLAFQAIYGDKQVLKVNDTEATSCLLDELKAVNLDELEGSFVDPTEDLTTYDYADPNSDFTIISSRITFDGVRRDVEAYVRDNKGSNHFGDFEHLVHYSITASQAAASVGVWVLNNGQNSLTEMESAGIGLALYLSSNTGGGGSDRSPYLYDYTNDNFDYNYNEPDRYCTLARNGSTATCAIYTDAERTNLIDTLTITCGANQYSYVYGFVSVESGTYPDREMTGYVEELDLQEAPEIIEKTSGDAGGGADARVAGNPWGTLSKSETGSGADSLYSLLVRQAAAESGSGADALAAVLADLVQADSGSGVEQSLLSLWLSSSESGSASEGLVSLLTALLEGDSGLGVEGISDRDLVLHDSGAGADSLLALLATVLRSEMGSGVEQSLLSIATDRFSADTGSGTDTAALIRALISGDGGIGSELTKLWKDILGIDGGTGGDALKALVTAGGSGMRLHGRRGRASQPSHRVRKPYKGVNL